jgi:hypothetical protein
LGVLNPENADVVGREVPDGIVGAAAVRVHERRGVVADVRVNGVNERASSHNETTDSDRSVVGYAGCSGPRRSASAPRWP